MKRRPRFFPSLLSLSVLAFVVMGLQPAHAVDKNILTLDAEAALASLYTNSPGAKTLGESAAGILVFPSITKAGFIVGAQGGSGVLFRKGSVAGFYHSGALSVGMQAGYQTYGYALFLLSDADVANLNSAQGWSLGVGPSIVVADKGFGSDVSTTTLKSGVYAFIFDQKGIMAGLGVVGQKITPLK